MTNTKIIKTLREAMKLCKEKGIEGICWNINGYYTEFKFSKLKTKCEKCGQEIIK